MSLVKHSENGLVWYTFSIFAPHPELRHGVLTNDGPHSTGKFSLAFNEVEADETVSARLALVENTLGLSPLASARQTHSAKVLVVKAQDNYHPRTLAETINDYDALLTSDDGVSLLIKIADCQGAILYDPQARILGLVHSGWRGSVQNILGVTVEKMVAAGAESQRIKAAIGPSLGPCCAEFVNYAEELPKSFQDFMAGPNHFDFWAISKHQLTTAGLRPENIDLAGVCTQCSPEFFSFRGGDVWERFGIVAAMQKAL